MFNLSNSVMTSSYKNQLKVRWVLPILLGVLFSLGDTIAANNGKLIFNGFSFVITMVLLPVLFSLAFFVGETCLHRFLGEVRFACHLSRRIGIIFARIENFIFCNSKVLSIAIIFAAILLFWIPWMIWLYPGIYWSDTSQQLLEYFGLVALSDHHPFLMTVVLGLFASFGRFFLHSESAGLFLLVIFQCAVAVYYFSRLLWELHDAGLKMHACIALFLFITIFPFIPLMFCSIAKDTFSCAFFLGFLLQLFLVYKSDGDCLRSPKTLLGILFFASVASLTKKTTGYVVVFCLVSLCLAYRSRALFIRVIGVCTVFIGVVFVFFPRVILPAFEVAPGGKQEMIATLIQQVAHDVTFQGDSLSSEDKNLIDDFLLVNCDQIPSRYDWQIVDPIKERGLHNDSRLGDFISLWAKNTLKHPFGHLEAWLGLVDGWITFRSDWQGTPNYMVVLTYSGWHDEGIGRCVDWNDQITSGGTVAEKLFRTIQSIPVINCLFYRSFWATIVPFFLLFLLLGRFSGDRLKALTLLMPIFASIIPLVITPVSIMGGEPTRYLFAIVCCSPFMMAAVFCDDATSPDIKRRPKSIPFLGSRS